MSSLRTGTSEKLEMNPKASILLEYDWIGKRS